MDDLLRDDLYRANMSAQMFMVQGLIRALVLESANPAKMRAIGTILLGSDHEAKPADVSIEEWTIHRAGLLHAFETIFDGVAE